MGLSVVRIVEELDESGWMSPDHGEPDMPRVQAKESVFRLDWDGFMANQDQRIEWLPSEESVQKVLETVGIGPPTGEAERQRIIERRADVCAWYQPIHYYGLDWGIFVKHDCLMRIAGDVGRFVNRSLSTTYRPWPGGLTLYTELVRAAFFHLFLHEAFHHKTESLATRLEVAGNKKVFLPYKERVYRPAMRAGVDPGALEESLANADSFRRLAESTYRSRISRPVLEALREYLVWRFPFDPPGYKQASAYLDGPSFEQGLHILEEQILTAKNTRHAAHRWTLAPNLNKSFFSLRSDIWVVVDKGTPCTIPFLPMRIGSVSAHQLRKALGNHHGYREVKGGKGSHVKLQSDGLPTLTLPSNKRELSPGVVRQIAQALQIEDMAAYLGV